jgi:hypothetical protein
MSMKFLNNAYNASYDYDEIDDVSTFQFESIDESKGVSIGKVIEMSPSDYMDGIYNVALSNQVVEDGEIVGYSDTSRENNKQDGEKVIDTVFSCMLRFLEYNPSVTVGYCGNTPLKRRYYNMRMAVNIEVLENEYYVFGGIADFDESKDENNEKVITNVHIDEDKIERYKVSNSRNYHFVLIRKKS